jgi:hypothetical protein
LTIEVVSKPSIRFKFKAGQVGQLQEYIARIGPLAPTPKLGPRGSFEATSTPFGRQSRSHWNWMYMALRQHRYNIPRCKIRYFRIPASDPPVSNIEANCKARMCVNEKLPINIIAAKQFVVRREILRSIANHTCQDIYHLQFNTLSFLLYITDEIQFKIKS